MRERTALGRRIRSALVNQAVAGVASGALVAALLATRPRRPDATVGAQVVAAIRDGVVMILPALVVGTVDDCSNRVGKRATGFEVQDRTGHRVGAARAVFRNVLKNLPWQVAHIGVRQQVSGIGGRFGSAVGISAIVAAVLGVGTDLVVFIRTGRTVYDRLAGTAVVDLRPRPVAGSSDRSDDAAAPDAGPRGGASI